MLARWSNSLSGRAFQFATGDSLYRTADLDLTMYLSFLIHDKLEGLLLAP